MKSGELRYSPLRGPSSPSVVSFPSRNNDAASLPAPREDGERTPYPTVLVASSDDRLREILAQSVLQIGAHVLEARNESNTVEIIRTHSRPIHVLLIDFNLGRDGFVASLRRYRPDMHVVFVDEVAGEDKLVSTLEGVLSNVRELLHRFHGRSSELVQRIRDRSGD
jgi:hypothetical protein